MIDATCWKTLNNPHAVPHACTPSDGEAVESSNRLRHEIRKCVTAGQRKYDEPAYLFGSIHTIPCLQVKVFNGQ